MGFRPLVVPYETGEPCTGQSLSSPPGFSFGEPWRTGGKRVTEGPPISIEWEVDAKRGGLGKKKAILAQGSSSRFKRMMQGDL